MIVRPPGSTRTDTLVPYTTLCRGDKAAAARQNRKADRADRVLLDPIFQASRKHAGKGGQDHAVAFADAFYHRLTADELPLHDPAGWAALASDFLDFARTRKRGTANVRLFNPDMKQHGWESPHTVLQIVNDDMPFLVDSVTMALAEQGIGVYVLGHPVVPITRDRAGKLLEVGEGNPESLMHMEIDRLTGDAIDTVRTTLQGGHTRTRGWRERGGQYGKISG